MSGFPERSRNLRKKLSLTQEEMADKFGLTRAYYGLLETSKKEPSDTILKMLELLEYSAEVKSMQDQKPLVAMLDEVMAAEEEPAYYGTNLRKALKRELHDLAVLIENANKQTQSWILVELRRHFSPEILNEVSKLGDLQEKAKTDSEKDKITKKINEHLSLTENPDYREKKPAREGRPAPEYTGGGLQDKSDSGGKASGG